LIGPLSTPTFAAKTRRVQLRVSSPGAHAGQRLPPALLVVGSIEYFGASVRVARAARQQALDLGGGRLASFGLDQVQVARLGRHRACRECFL
jgi:hypothetical protein